MTGLAGVAPRRTGWLIFLLVWLSVAWFGSWEYNPNTATRLFASVALVETGDARIDRLAPLTIDKAVFDGHAYSDKAPGMTLLALPAVAVATWASGERSTDVSVMSGAADLTRFLRLRTRLAVATGPAPLIALAAMLLFHWGLALTARADAAAFSALGFALGTPVWGWATTLTGHAPVASLLVIGAWCLWRATDGGGSARLALAGGGALGFAVVIEYPAVLAGGVVALWAAGRAWPRGDRWRVLGWAILGGMAGLLPLFTYNMAAFGTPFRVGYAGVQGFEGMRQGLFGLGWPRSRVLFEVLAGDRRGLIWVAPVLILAPLGLAELADRRDTRGLALMAAAVVAVVLLVNAAYFYWDGGNSTGPRHAVPLIGLLALGLAPIWAMLGRWGRIGAAGLLGGSMALNLMIAAADIFSPPDRRWPVWSYVYRVRFRLGDIRTWPGEWLDWAPWSGFWLYLAVALPVLGWVVVRVRRGSF